MGKVFVQIVAEHDVQGKIKPIAIKWQDGRMYQIDRVLDVRTAASLKAGGQGTRYTCRVSGKEVYLFCDDGRWFLER